VRSLPEAGGYIPLKTKVLVDLLNFVRGERLRFFSDDSSYLDTLLKLIASREILPEEIDSDLSSAGIPNNKITAFLVILTKLLEIKALREELNSLGRYVFLFPQLEEEVLEGLAKNYGLTQEERKEVLRAIRNSSEYLKANMKVSFYAFFSGLVVVLGSLIFLGVSLFCGGYYLITGLLVTVLVFLSSLWQLLKGIYFFVRFVIADFWEKRQERQLLELGVALVDRYVRTSQSYNSSINFNSLGVFPKGK